MTVDPWGGVNRANDNLNDAFIRARAEDRQSRLDDVNMQAARQQLSMGGIQLQNAQRQQTDAADLRAQLAGAQPQTTTAFTPPVDTASAADKLGMTPLPYTQNPQPAAPLTGSLDSEMQQNGLAATPTPDASGFQMPTEPVSPAVQAYTSGDVQSTTTQPDTNKIILDHALKSGDVDRINAVKTQIAAQAKSIVDITGNPMEGLKLVNAAMGTNYSIMKTPDLELVKNGDEIVAMRDKGGEKLDMMNGMSLSDAVNKNMVPISLGGGSQLVNKYLSEHPNATAQEMWKLSSDNNIPLKTIEPIISKLQAAENERGKDARQERQFQHTEAMQTSRQAHSDSVIAKALQGKNAMSTDAVDLAADQYLLTGQMPALGMGGASAKMAILNKAAEKAKAQGLDASGIVTEMAQTKANAGSLTQQQKQIGAMGSFVKNIDKQVNRFDQLSKEVASFDTRLLNIPLRQVRGKIAGSPNQAKLDMYLTEISSETGKLASGATGSVAELSQGAREKWEKIHDPNLSMADLLSLLKETRHAGQMRMQSVKEQLDETRSGMQNRGNKATQGGRPSLDAIFK